TRGAVAAPSADHARLHAADPRAQVDRFPSFEAIRRHLACHRSRHGPCHTGAPRTRIGAGMPCVTRQLESSVAYVWRAKVAGPGERLRHWRTRTGYYQVISHLLE